MTIEADPRKGSLEGVANIPRRKYSSYPRVLLDEIVIAINHISTIGQIPWDCLDNDLR